MPSSLNVTFQYLISSLQVVDDPQLTALIPIARRCNPRAKIVFRSHIEIRSDLIAQEHEQIRTTWDYLWKFIKQADVFVAHPVEYFVPQMVKDTMPVVYMPRMWISGAIELCLPVCMQHLPTLLTV